MIACNIPANINRKEFAFEKWQDWDSELFDTILESLLKKTKESHYTIIQAFFIKNFKAYIFL